MSELSATRRRWYCPTELWRNVTPLKVVICEMPMMTETCTWTLRFWIATAEQSVPIQPDVQRLQSLLPCQFGKHVHVPLRASHSPWLLHGLIDPPGQTSLQLTLQKPTSHTQMFISSGWRDPNAHRISQLFPIQRGNAASPNSLQRGCAGQSGNPRATWQ